MKNNVIPALILLIIVQVCLTGCQSSSRRKGNFEMPQTHYSEEGRGDTQATATAAEIKQAQATEPELQSTEEIRTADVNRWSRWMDRFRQPKRIPFPRTDLQQDEAGSDLVDMQQKLGEF